MFIHIINNLYGEKVQMKKSFISVLCLFFLSVTCAAEEQEGSEGFKMIQLAWDQLFDKMKYPK